MTQTYEAAGADLAIVEERPLHHFFDVTPDEQIAMMTEVAAKANRVIQERGWFATFVDKKTGEAKRYIEVEGWQFIGSLMRCMAKPASPSRAIDNGFEATYDLIRCDSGIVVGGGDGMCTKDEYNWKNRDPYAIRGMAQTRAVSRTFRNAFAFVAKLAGYEPTPAAEVPPGGFSGGFEPQAPKTRVEAPRVPQDELLALAVSVGAADSLKDLGAWCVAQGIAPDLMRRERKVLTDAETVRAKAQLEAMIPPRPPAKPPASGVGPEDDGGKMQHRTRGRLFALFEERLSTDKAAQLAFAAEHGVVVTSRSDITEAQARLLIRKLEMIPPVTQTDRDAIDAALDEYARERLP